MRSQTPPLHAHFPALQIANAANALMRKQFEAANVHACHDREGLAGIDGNNTWRREVHSQIHLAAPERLRQSRWGPQDIFNVGEPFRAQQILSDILWRHANSRAFRKSNSARFGRSLLRKYVRTADEAHAGGRRKCG